MQLLICAIVFAFACSSILFFYAVAQVTEDHKISGCTYELHHEKTGFFMPPTSEEVEGAYWFGSVRPVQ